MPENRIHPPHMRKDTLVLGQLAYVCCGIAVLAMHVPDWRVSNLTAFATFEQSLTAPPEPDHDKNPHPLQFGGLTDLLVSPHMDDACYSSGTAALAKSNRSKMMVRSVAQQCRRVKNVNR